MKKYFIFLILLVFYFSKVNSADEKKLISPANHSIQEVSYCLSFYIMVSEFDELAPDNINYINEHLNYLDLQKKIINKLYQNTQNLNFSNALDILNHVKKSSEYTEVEKDFIIGFTNGKIDYMTLNSLDRELKRFFCYIPQ